MSMDLPEFWSFNRRRDACQIATRALFWSGPHVWPGYGCSDSEVPVGSGVYLTTFAHQDGFIFRSAGVSGAIRRRLREHERAFLRGAHASRQPWGDLVDGGMQLRGRFSNEMPIRLLNQCSARLYGLPPEMEV